MASLSAKTPFDGALPVKIGTVTMTELTYGAVTSIAPLAGRKTAVSDALQSQIGFPFPAPNRSAGDTDTRIVWTGMDQAFVLGPVLSPIDGAAMTDQSDAWAAFEIDGHDARAILARLTSIDLRPRHFGIGDVARTQIGHMSAILLRSGPERYAAMIFRSMAGTALHDLTRAMRMVAARATHERAG